jgi:predicted transcriptional regulator
VPSKVEALVMKSLVGRRMTAPEVRGVLGSSREHAARIMKSLADEGLVVRDTLKKPYTYELSDVGRDMVTGDSLPGP